MNGKLEQYDIEEIKKEMERGDDQDAAPRDRREKNAEVSRGEPRIESFSHVTAQQARESRIKHKQAIDAAVKTLESKFKPSR